MSFLSFFLNLFRKKKEAVSLTSPVAFSYQDYFKGRDVQFKEEFTSELLANYETLLAKVSGFLTELGAVPLPHFVDSGWRPAAINAKTPGAAVHSAHLVCKAVDLADTPEGLLWHHVSSRPDLLRKYGLFLEDRVNTPNWVHLDYVERQDRPNRIFLAK